MSCIDICDLCIGEECLDGWDRVERYILRFGSSDEKRGPLVLEPVCFSEREVCHVVERLAEHREGHSELERLVLGADEVCEKELADWKGLAQG